MFLLIHIYAEHKYYEEKLNNIIRFILFWSNYIDGNIVIDVYDKLKKNL